MKNAEITADQKIHLSLLVIEMETWSSLIESVPRVMRESTRRKMALPDFHRVLRADLQRP